MEEQQFEILVNLQKDGFKLTTWIGMEYFQGYEFCKENLALKHLIFMNSQTTSSKLRADGLKCCDDVLSCTYLFHFSHYLYLHYHIQGLRLMLQIMIVVMMLQMLQI